MEYKEIRFEEKGSVAHLTLNRPDIRNAITGETIINEIEDVCHRVQNNNDINVLIVTGAGSAFSAGGNVKDMHNKQGMFSGNPDQLREN
ncbi:MAG: enoyl-CoA hydratase-related protein, partial [Desulfobacteraceae bacterium]|nr:enoyl-CoA hydratase-related protein [Desulfobacteraceae bacterium]